MKHAGLWFASHTHGLYASQIALNLFCHYHTCLAKILKKIFPTLNVHGHVFESVSQDVLLFLTMFMHLIKECLQCKSVLLSKFMCVSVCVVNIYATVVGSHCQWL